jgi:hypothetical protein
VAGFRLSYFPRHTRVDLTLAVVVQGKSVLINDRFIPVKIQ